MSNYTKRELTALQNSIEYFNINAKIKLFFEDDKRKKTKFILTKDDYTISEGLTKEQAEADASHFEDRFSIDVDIVEETAEQKENALIERQQFIDYFRSDKYNEQMSADDCLEIFEGSVKGSSDLTVDLFNNLLDNYSAGFTVEKTPEEKKPVKPLFILMGKHNKKCFKDFNERVQEIDTDQVKQIDFNTEEDRQNTIDLLNMSEAKFMFLDEDEYNLIKN